MVLAGVYRYMVHRHWRHRGVAQMSAAPRVNWMERIRAWRQANTTPVITAPVAEALKLQLYDLLPGQFIILNSKVSGREYAVLELDDLRDLLTRAGMVMRNPK